MPFSIQRGQIHASLSLILQWVSIKLKCAKGERKRLQVGLHGGSPFFWDTGSSPLGGADGLLCLGAQLLPSTLLLLGLT